MKLLFLNSFTQWEALYAGDYNVDGVIQSTDYDVWQSEPAVINVYAPTDGNPRWCHSGNQF